VADAIISRGTSALIDFVQLTDTEGRIVLLPAAMCDHLRSAGQASVTMTVSLQPGRAAEEWLTIQQAATEHLDDVDGLTLNAARTAINRAIKSNALVWKRVANRVVVEPTSFRAWRLIRAKRDLDRHDDVH